MDNLVGTKLIDSRIRQVKQQLTDGGVTDIPESMEHAILTAYRYGSLDVMKMVINALRDYSIVAVDNEASVLLEALVDELGEIINQIDF